jgi:hypothetical protein
MADVITKDVLTLDEIKTVIGQEKKAMVIYDVSTGAPNGLDVEVLINMDASISNEITERQTADTSAYALAVEMIAYNATAPSPVIPTGTTKTYEFSSGGLCSWITGGAVTVEKGDKVTVTFTAPNTYVRTYQDVVSRKANTSAISEVGGSNIQSIDLISSNYDLIDVNIEEGETFKVKINASSSWDRIILVYNNNVVNRLIDSVDDANIVGYYINFVAPVKITKLGLECTGTNCVFNIAVETYGKLGSMFNILTNYDNLLFQSEIHKNAFYNGIYKETSSSYTYFVIDVVSGTTYYFYPHIRFIAKENALISGESYSGTYTADFTGKLYITFFNDEPDWIFASKSDYSKICGYNTTSFTEVSLSHQRGSSKRLPISQSGAMDCVSDYLHGSSNLLAGSEYFTNAFYNGYIEASTIYCYYKIYVRGDVEYIFSDGVRYIANEAGNLVNYPNISNSFTRYKPLVSEYIYVTFYNLSTGRFVGKYSDFKNKDMLFAKKWVSCGDSFTRGGYISPATYTDMPYIGMNKVYPYIIGRRCNMNIINEAIGGSTMAYIDGTKNEFSTVGGRYTKIPSDADYITLWFGINDSHQNVPIGTINDNTNTTFYGAWNIVMDYLITNHPNAKIGIVISNGCDTTAYPMATRIIAKKFGISYLDLNGDYTIPLMLRVNEKTDIAASVLQAILEKQSVSYPDNQHPNDAAHEYQSSFIETWLRSL